jgi:hypothetical protein
MDNHVQKGHTSVDEGELSGGPSTYTAKEDTERVRAMIPYGRRVTTDEVEYHWVSVTLQLME